MTYCAPVRNCTTITLLLLAASAVTINGCATGTPVDDNNDDITPVTFQDPDSDFSTTDVVDIDGDVVRFDAASARMIWVADNLLFDDFDVDGNLLADGFFTVRFGSENGQPMAYFTETDPPTICDISVTNGNLSITSTDQTVPQN